MFKLKMLAVTAAVCVSQAAFSATYDFGLMGPPADKTITTSAFAYPDQFTDYFTFSLVSPSDASGHAPDTQFWIFGADVKSISLYTSSNLQIGALDKTPDTFTFKNLAAGAYKLVVTGKGYLFPSYNVRLITEPVTSVTVATAVPEPQTVSMIVAGLGLIGFAASRQRRL